MTPRDVLELSVLDATGDAVLAEQAGFVAATVVGIHAELLALLTSMPAGFFEPQLWEAINS